MTEERRSGASEASHAANENSGGDSSAGATERAMNDRPRTARFRVRFSLAAALLGLIGSAFAMAWIGRPWLSAYLLERQHEAEDAAIRALGACTVSRDDDGRMYIIAFRARDVFDDMLPEILRHKELVVFETNPTSYVNGIHWAVPRVGLTDAGVERLATLTKLDRLAVHGEGVTDACLPALARMPNLSCLQLVNTSVSDAALQRHFAGRQGAFGAFENFEPTWQDLGPPKPRKAAEEKE